MLRTPTPRGAHRELSHAAAAAALSAAAAILPACEGLERAAQQETLLAIIPAPTSPQQAALWAADPYDPSRRARGLQLLANAYFGGESVYISLYEDYLDDPDATVRANAAFALGVHGSPTHVPMIIPLVRDEERVVRLNAVRALQRLHNPQAVTPLIEATDPEREPDPDIRAEATHALGQYAESRVLQALIAALGDPRLNVNLAARYALEFLTGHDHGDDRRAWLDWLAETDDPFEHRTAYVYPVFQRSKRPFEYIPFWPDPPNETPANPAGFPVVQID